MNEYKLMFTVTIKDHDDPAARKQAKGIIESLGEVVAGAEAKLQQVYTDRSPRGVRMEVRVHCPTQMLPSPLHAVHFGVDR